VTMKRTLKSGAPLEDDEQIALVEWVDRWRGQVPELEMFAAIPNGGKRTHQVGKDGKRFSIEAARLKRMGVRAGYPDLLLDAGGHHGLRIELKAQGGRLSTVQGAWLARLKAAGYAAVVCFGWPHAAHVIAGYLAPRLMPDLYRNLLRSIPYW
jgi:hypothetical protein